MLLKILRFSAHNFLCRIQFFIPTSRLTLLISKNYLVVVVVVLIFGDSLVAGVDIVGLDLWA